MSAEEQQLKPEAAGDEMDTSETTAVNDEDERKLFVGGLPQDIKDTELKTHFEAFGEIETVNMKTDPTTGRSRGFAFVIYKSPEGVEKAVAKEEHELKGKKVAVKKAQSKQGKIYVGKLKPEITHFFVTKSLLILLVSGLLWCMPKIPLISSLHRAGSILAC